MKVKGQVRWAAPDRIRTCDRRIRRPLLCPAELRGQGIAAPVCRRGAWWTCDTGVSDGSMDLVTDGARMAPCDAVTAPVPGPAAGSGERWRGRPMGSRGVVGRRAAFGAVTALVVSGGLTVTVGPAYADHSVVELVTTSAAAGNGPFDADPVGATDDGSRVFFETDEPMVASDTDGEQDVYERTGGVTTLVSTGPGDATSTPAVASYGGTSADGTHVFFESAQQLVPGDTDTNTDAYERTGGQTLLVSTAPNPPTQTVNAQLRAVSTDGTRAIFFTRDRMVAADVDGSLDVYLRAGGQTTLLTGGSALADAQFRGASPDVGRVLFDTLEALVPEDTDASRDIYEAVGGAVHLVSTSATAGNGAFNVITSDRSDDASAVLFVTDEAMVPADTDALRDVYLRSNGQTSLVSVGTTTAPVGGGDLSADGTHVVFTTNESLDPADTDAEDDLYQWAAGQVSLISTGRQTPGGQSVRNTQSEDGSRVVFTSEEPLVPQDTDPASTSISGAPARRRCSLRARPSSRSSPAPRATRPGSSSRPKTPWCPVTPTTRQTSTSRRADS